MDVAINHLQHTHQNVLSSSENKESILASKQSIIDSLLKDKRSSREEYNGTIASLNQ